MRRRWRRYNLSKALALRFDPMLEQDALNVAMIEIGSWVRAPSVMNWLCSLSIAVRAADGTWRHPDDAQRRILVAHLTNSTARITLPNGPATLYDFYRLVGLAE